PAADPTADRTAAPAPDSATATAAAPAVDPAAATPGPAYRAARVWTLESDAPLEDHAVVLDGAGRIAAVVPAAAAPHATDLGDVHLAPGFVDAQVNGGGGVLFNDDPTPEGVRAIAAAHRRFGTVALLPTLITDAPAALHRARAAVDACIEAGDDGVLGVHFEGPFLDEARRGAHPAEHLRDPSPADLDALFGPGEPRGVTLVTASPARLAGGGLKALLDRGAVVSLGHADATFEEATGALEAGARGVTHLYNAMTGLHHRAPGVVGAALAHERAFAGLILDGVHVADGAALTAYRALGPDRLFLVTDAVQPVGTDLVEFELGGQHVRREGLRCVNEEG
ncbi:MAG: N-acetylglucosamine-6-phosphate deacetylase, partial [Planctomycetota bacterium]